jgi:hypothetical protein
VAVHYDEGNAEEHTQTRSQQHRQEQEPHVAAPLTV